MIDPGLLLQTEYFSLLNGQVTYAGSIVPVYDTVPANATYPYIQIGDKTDIDFSNKSTQGNEVTQGISVVDRFQASTGGRNSVYSISNALMQILTARPNPFNIEELNVITSVLDNSLTRQELTSTYHYRIVELRFRHLIEQIGLGVFDDTFDLTFN
jgi:hypothetical protein